MKPETREQLFKARNILVAIKIAEEDHKEPSTGLLLSGEHEITKLRGMLQDEIAGSLDSREIEYYHRLDLEVQNHFEKIKRRRQAKDAVGA